LASLKGALPGPKPWISMVESVFQQPAKGSGFRLAPE
jgi:hypothetical protein